MPDATDMDLLRDYAEHQSESAFNDLVQRHIHLVYSVAWRFVRNNEDARDVTQAVFIRLARKAGGFRPKTILSGWLYETTRFTATNFLTSKMRRQRREQEAYMQSTLNEAATDWQLLEPHLEAAMANLAGRDRALLVLRFYENKTAAEAAALLGIREDAAHKRVTRAVEKLRKFFTKRGVTISDAAIAGAVSANSVQAAPVGLVKFVSATAVAKGATASTSTLTLIKGTLKIMAYKKVALISVGVVVALLVGVTVSSPTARSAIKSLPEKIASNIPAEQRKAALRQQMWVMKGSVWPALMQFSKEHNGNFPKSMAELRPYLTPGLAGLDDDHWRITAGNASAKPNTPELLSFCEQINQPAGQPRIILYADGHVEYRK